MVKTTRNTKQKLLMTKKLSRMTSFFFADEFHKIIKEEDDSIGIATVYRFLNDLKKENKLFTYTCDRKTIYSTGKKSHCHFICERTKKVTHFDIDSLDFLKNKIPGSIKSFQLEVIGECNDDCKICNHK